MSETTYDWTKFNKRIAINAPISSIYDAWTKAAEIEKWFLSKAIFRTQNKEQRAKSDPIHKGDNYEWHWYGSDHVGTGKILAVNGKNQLQFTFFDCPTTVEIKVEAGENVVELTQTDIPPDETSIVNLHVGCSRGWTFYLANLKSYLEGGIDLRNRNDKLVDVINT